MYIPHIWHHSPSQGSFCTALSRLTGRLPLCWAEEGLSKKVHLGTVFLFIFYGIVLSQSLILKTVRAKRVEMLLAKLSTPAAGPRTGQTVFMDHLNIVLWQFLREFHHMGPIVPRTHLRRLKKTFQWDFHWKNPLPPQPLVDAPGYISTQRSHIPSAHQEEGGFITEMPYYPKQDSCIQNTCLEQSLSCASPSTTCRNCAEES